MTYDCPNEALIHSWWTTLQLPDAQIPIVLYVTPSSLKDEHRHMPAIHFTANKSCCNTENTEIYKHLLVTVKNMTLTLEEKLLCKLLKLAGVTRTGQELEKLDESVFEAQRDLIASTTTDKRYYFANLMLTLDQVKLSVILSSKLPPDLRAVKRKLGLSLISFEDASLELRPFSRNHPFETFNFLTNSIVKHFSNELWSQAMNILGSTDLLGNPIGLFNDISEGKKAKLNTTLYSTQTSISQVYPV